jgi:hypothetical protein
MDRCLLGIHHRLGGGRGRERVVELLLTNRLLRRKRAEAVDVLLRLRQLRLGLRQIPLGLLELRLHLPGVDLEHQIALVHEAPLGIHPPQQIAVHPRPDLGVDVSRRRADPLLEDRHISLHDRRHHHRRRRRRSVLVGFLVLALATHQRGANHPSRDHR